MPAYFNEGFSVREPMWHGLGTVLDEYPGREEAMVIAGHDFVVIEQPSYIRQHDILGFESYVEVPGFKTLTKGETATVLNQVNKSYGVVQNEILWDIVDALVDQPNVKYETAGVLRDGKVLWVLAKLDEPYTVTGDNSLIYPYIMASTTHDGSGACQSSAVNVRVVCWNTFEMAKASGRHFTFRHTKNVSDRIEDAKMALSGVRVQHEEFVALSEELAAISLRQDQVKLFIENLIPMPSEALISDRVIKNVNGARGKIQLALDSPTTADAHRNTGFGVWQAGIEYMDHLRAARTIESKFGRTMLSQEPAKAKLAQLVRECAKA